MDKKKEKINSEEKIKNFNEKDNLEIINKSSEKKSNIENLKENNNENLIKSNEDLNLNKLFTDEIIKLYAEIDNLHKRNEKIAYKEFKNGVFHVIKEILPFFDSINTTFSLIKNNATNEIVEGINLTNEILNKFYKTFNIEIINPINEVFNPSFHEAVSLIESKIKADNIIVEVLQVGYKLNNNVLRYALVNVSKNIK